MGMSGLTRSVDRVLAVVSAAAAPVLTSLVDFHVLSAGHATDLGAVVVAVVSGWHGGSAYTARAVAKGGQ
jgi:uncharacterized membrane protein